MFKYLKSWIGDGFSLLTTRKIQNFGHEYRFYFDVKYSQRTETYLIILNRSDKYCVISNGVLSAEGFSQRSLKEIKNIDSVPFIKKIKKILFEDIGMKLQFPNLKEVIEAFVY